MRDAAQFIGWLALALGSVVAIGGVGAEPLSLARLLVGVGVLVACVGAVLVRWSIPGRAS